MNDARPKRRRRWVQFSLRTLLVFVTLCAVASSWFVVKMKQVKKRREAVKAIMEAGGSVRYEYSVNAQLSGSTPKPPGPAWIRKLLGDDFFATVLGVTREVRAQMKERLQQIRQSGCRFKHKGL